jgi:hypothetical protein
MNLTGERLQNLIVLTLTLVSMLTQHGIGWAAGSEFPLGGESVSPSSVVVLPKVEPMERTWHDIALYENGRMQGKVVNRAGVAVAFVPIILQRSGVLVAQMETDRDGTFRIENLRGGVYALQAGNAKRLYRVWAPGTAPPAANPSALVIVNEEIIRGQLARDRFPYGTVQPSIEAWAWGAAIAAGVYVPLYTGRDRNPGS